MAAYMLVDTATMTSDCHCKHGWKEKREREMWKGSNGEGEHGNQLSVESG